MVGDLALRWQVLDLSHTKARGSRLEQAEAPAMDGDNIEVWLDQGGRVSVHPWTSPERIVHYPLRIGYASTLHKVQGLTLPHITLWLDIANMPAAAYVALSRVEHDANWRFVGDPGVHHFTPACF